MSRLALSLERSNKDEVGRWIRDTFYMRRCSTFIAKTNKDGKVDNDPDPMCCCGHEKSTHTEKAKEAEVEDGVAWDPEEHTDKIPTSAYGEMEFTGFGYKKCRYVCVDQTASEQNLLDLMRNQWHLEPPKLIISVTGGAKAFHIREHTKRTFQRGLMKAATSTGAWITTGGMAAGVMKIVGEAVQQYQMAQGGATSVTTLGIAPWGCVTSRKLLQDESGSWPANYRPGEDDRTAAIERNHSHMIFVDNGTQNEYGTEIELRARLEAAIANTTMYMHQSIRIPTVCVMLEGGPGTIETVKSSLEKGIPAVIVEGSGRAADILAFAYNRVNEIEIIDDMTKRSAAEGAVWEDVKRQLAARGMGGHALEWIQACIKHKNLMVVCKLDEADADMDLAILQALLQANSGNEVTQLKLALAWDRSDVAKDMIFSTDRKWQQHELEAVMHSALVGNNEQFTRLFLENGLSLKDFISRDRLVRLYNEIPSSTLFYKVLKRCQDKSRQHDPFEWSDISRALDSMTNGHYTPLFPKTGGARKHLTGDVGPCAARGLFVWSVIQNRRDLAMVFWEETHDCLPATLLGEILLKALLKETDNIEDREDLGANIEYFENLAVGVLATCNLSDEKKTGLILVRELEMYGGATPLQLAEQADNKTLVAHSGCQALLKTIWKGRMPQDTRGRRLLLTFFLPFLVKFINFRADDRDCLKETTDKNRNTVKSSQNSAKGPGFLKKLYFFYTAPAVVTIANCMAYITLIILYGTFLMTSYQKELTSFEIFLIAWVTIIMCEEIRQFSETESEGWGRKLREHFGDNWNVLDFLVVTLFCVGTGLRFAPPESCPECFEAGRVVLAFFLLSTCIRVLRFFSIYRSFGPKLVMIGRMLVDLAQFMVILLLLVVAFGMSTHALMFPNDTLDTALFEDVVRRPYWNMYGELFLDEIEGTAECSDDPAVYHNESSGLARCASNTWLIPGMTAVYVLFTNVLMLNLLIAMFSNTFAAIEDNTDKVWRFIHYKLVVEMAQKPVLPPPFLVFGHLYLIIRALLRAVCPGRFEEPPDVFKVQFNLSEERQMVMWEKMAAMEYLQNAKVEATEAMDNRVEHIYEKVDEMAERLEERVFVEINALKRQVKQIQRTVDRKLDAILQQLSKK